MRKYSFAKNFLILSLFSLYEGSPVVGEYFNCTEPFREDNLLVVICLSLVNNTATLPRNISTNIQGLYILSYFSQGALMIEDMDTFQRFSHLVKLQMITRKGLVISNKLLEPGQLRRLRNELFNLPHLEALGITHIEFNSKGHLWVLPESLKALLISNSAFKYDLRKCSLLEMLELPNDDLQNVPTLSNPPPPLKWLNLSRNPLRNLTLSDIAGFCDLRIFGLDQANLNYCECLRVILWIRNKKEEMEEFMFTGSLECDNVVDHDCSGYTLQEAESLRQQCIFDRLWDVIVWISSIIAVSAIVVVVCLLIAYKLKKLSESSEA